MTKKRFYCDDGLSKRDYAIYDLSKADKSFNDFKNEDGLVESWRFGCYLCDETDSLMTGEEVVDKLNKLNNVNKELKDKNSQLQETLAFRSNQLALMERLVDDLGSEEMARQMEEILND